MHASKTLHAYPSLLLQRAASAGYPHRFVNAGVTGDTTADGLRRFDAAVISDTRDLASQFSLPLMPFMLAGIFGDPALNLPDGFHPNAVGMRVLAASMWPYLEPLLQETSP